MPNKEMISKKNKRYPIAVYIIIMLLGILFIVFPILVQLSDFSSSVFVNLGSDFIGVTLIFFVLRYFLIDDTTSYNLDDVKSEISDHITSEMHKISTHAPDRTYESSQSATKSFNLDLTTDISKSSFYFFRGASAKYVPVRLLGTRNSLGQVRIVMLDPINDSTVELRARDRARRTGDKGKSISQLSTEIREEIYMTVISLFDCRHQLCPIEIIYDNSGTSVYRLEILDQHTYISFYKSDVEYEFIFPETIRYPKESLIHNMYKLDIQRLLGVSTKIFMIHKHSRETELYEHLKAIGCNVDDDTLQNYRNRFKDFYDKNKDTTNVFVR